MGKIPERDLLNGVRKKVWKKVWHESVTNKNKNKNKKKSIIIVCGLVFV